ncbi:ABC multidrug transporter [Purpureocillium lavendulum]|uniref:ABC multidrug transporter n=1 Tax=Purpureocillium lavendulum TaxID=1247861 RepID=A0AB34FTZ9_9HYPO|nr:ABC multidrug transporter [Purpureocillium lavendulum]
MAGANVEIPRLGDGVPFSTWLALIDFALEVMQISNNHVTGPKPSPLPAGWEREDVRVKAILALNVSPDILKRLLQHGWTPRNGRTAKETLDLIRRVTVYDPDETPPEPATPSSPARQTWTMSGYPIVDGKYLDLSTGVVRKIAPTEDVTLTPPRLEIYWHNRMLSGREDHFMGAVTSAFVDVTEYLRRVGRFLDSEQEKENQQGTCEVLALNATQCAINVIVAVECSNEDMMARLAECGLLHSRPAGGEPAD